MPPFSIFYFNMHYKLYIYILLFIIRILSFIYLHFEFSIGNDEIMQKLPLKSVIFIQKVAIYIAYCSKPSSIYELNKLAFEN